MTKRTGRKLIWFLSSYSPLYFGLMIKWIDFRDTKSIILSIVTPFWKLIFIFISFALARCQWRKLKKKSYAKEYQISKNCRIEPQSEQLLNYVVAYIFPLLTFDWQNYQLIIMNVYVFVIIAVIYVNSSITFLNPFLGLFGYKVYSVEGMGAHHHIVTKMSFDEFERHKREQRTVLQRDLGDGVAVIFRQDA